MRLSTLCLGLALLAPAAAAQDLVVERDGGTVTLTLPDGTVERFTVDAATPLRVRSTNGPLIVEREDGARVGPRAFAFRHRADNASFPGTFDFDTFDFDTFDFDTFDFDTFDFDTFDLEALADEHRDRLDSLRHGVRRFGHAGPFDVETFLRPGFGFERRGVAPETRREIAEGERRGRQLARALRDADGAERERLRRELRETLEQTFEHKQQARREHVEALRDDAERHRRELAEREAELDEREAARREIIERRERVLLGEDDAFDW